MVQRVGDILAELAVDGTARNIYGCYGLTHKRTIGNSGAPPSPERLVAGSIAFNAVNYMPSILGSNAAELNNIL
jgi:hypothetical protein